MPLSTMASAWLTGEHEVRLENIEPGLRLVLHHGSAAAPGTASSAPHVHSPWTETLVRLAAIPTDGSPDHVLNFGNIAPSWLRPSGERIGPTSLPATLLTPMVSAWPAPPTLASLTSFGGRPPTPAAPALATSVEVSRTIALLL